MKTARMILTAAILLSLKSTSYCSQEEEIPNLDDTIQIDRKPSFDALRDRNGWTKTFGTSWVGYTPEKLAQYTLEHCGEEYEGKEVRPGSDEESITLWTQQIQTLKQAQQFMKAVEKVKNSISSQVCRKAKQIITAVKEANFEETLTKYHGLNQSSKALLKTYTEEIDQRTQEDLTLQAQKKKEHLDLEEKYNAELKAAKLKIHAERMKAFQELSKKHQIEQDQLQQNRIKKDEELATTLMTNLGLLQQTKKTQKTNDPERLIAEKPFAYQTTDLSATNLAKFSQQYKTWQANPKTYAAVLSSTNNNSSSNI